MSACFEAGNLMAALEHPFDEVVATYERATQIVPARAEALHAASLYCRNQRPQRGRNGICAARSRSRSTDRTFRTALGLRLRTARRVCRQCLLGRRHTGSRSMPA